MAKKRKHNKKSRKLRKQRAASSATSINSSLATVEDQPKAQSKTVKTSPESVKPDVTYDDVDISYVKTDVRKTLILVAIILAVYALIWVLMTKTSLGTQAIHLINH